LYYDFTVRFAAVIIEMIILFVFKIVYLILKISDMKKILLIMFFLPLCCNISAQEGGEAKYKDPQNMDVIVQREAHFPAGEAALVKYLNENLVFPADYAAPLISGDFMVSFNVMPDSSLADFSVIIPIGAGNVDEQLIGLLSRLKYAPSVQNGVLLRMNVILSVPVRVKKE